MIPWLPRCFYISERISGHAIMKLLCTPIYLFFVFYWQQRVNLLTRSNSPPPRSNYSAQAPPIGLPLDRTSRSFKISQFNVIVKTWEHHLMLEFILVTGTLGTVPLLVYTPTLHTTARSLSFLDLPLWNIKEKQPPCTETGRLLLCQGTVQVLDLKHSFRLL